MLKRWQTRSMWAGSSGLDLALPIRVRAWAVINNASLYHKPAGEPDQKSRAEIAMTHAEKG